MKTILATLLIILTGCQTNVENHDLHGEDCPKFTELKEGDRLHLLFETVQCFGADDEDGYSYAITRDDMTYQGTILPEGRDYYFYKLTQEDKEELNQLLEYWQGDLDGGSTGSYLLTVTYVHNGKVISRWEYTDSSGSQCPISIGDVFMRVVERYSKQLNKEKPNQELEPTRKTPVESGSD